MLPRLKITQTREINGPYGESPVAITSLKRNIKCWLVVLNILKHMKVNGKDYPIYEMENKKCSKPPTRNESPSTLWLHKDLAVAKKMINHEPQISGRCILRRIASSVGLLHFQLEACKLLNYPSTKIVFLCWVGVEMGKLIWLVVDLPL